MWIVIEIRHWDQGVIGPIRQHQLYHINRLLECEGVAEIILVRATYSDQHLFQLLSLPLYASGNAPIASSPVPEILAAHHHVVPRSVLRSL